ncbi:MAG: tRNA pseudouridine(13) synthase TruD, partial [Phycisphaerales bacterium]|nr:tRNA pseudouridine(13) synthase TruD [Phycisphaerales bacterium]
MKLRRLPEDFGVVEHLTPGTLAQIRTTASATDGGASAAGERRELHAIYRLTKTQLTTPEASVMLARALKLKASAVEHAGLKDKHAVTTQHVSVRWEVTGAAAPDAPRELRSERDGAWGATFVGWMDRPLVAADIGHNQFTLVVRSLDRRDCDLLEARAKSLDDAGECWLANYFGDQRFGSARHGEGFAAAAMCHGDFLLAFRLLAGSPARKDTGRKRETTRLIASAWGPPDAAPGLAASPD